MAREMLLNWKSGFGEIENGETSVGNRLYKIAHFEGLKRPATLSFGMGEAFDEAKLQAINVGNFVFCAEGDAAFRDEQGRDDGAGSRRVVRSRSY